MPQQVEHEDEADACLSAGLGTMSAVDDGSELTDVSTSAVLDAV